MDIDSGNLFNRYELRKSGQLNRVLEDERSTVEWKSLVVACLWERTTLKTKKKFLLFIICDFSLKEIRQNFMSYIILKF